MSHQVLFHDRFMHNARFIRNMDHSVNLLFRVSVHNAVEVCRYTSTLLIIAFRITGSDWQWKLASLVIILYGLRLFRYATVLP